MTSTGQPLRIRPGRVLSSSATPVIHNGVGLCLMAVLATSLACESIVASSCGARPLDYWASLPNDVDRANRIVVTSRDDCDKALTVIVDASKVRVAAEFLKAHRDGWGENVNAGGCGAIKLDFYKDDSEIGWFGLTLIPADTNRARTAVISIGGIVRHVDVSELEALAERLGLQWPPTR